MCRLAVVLGLLIATAAPAAAEDDLGFRRTTPRSALHVAGDELVFGVPGGRAWGLESRLIRVGRGRSTVALDLAVDDPAIREGFVRIAWYARDEGRPRQLLTEDAPALPGGAGRRVIVRLDPPDQAIAFRVRVLARVGAGAADSQPDGLRVGRVRIEGSDRPRPALTRLRSNGP